MLPRRHFKPKDHWVIDGTLPHSQGLTCGKLTFISGQVDLDGHARVTRPGDLPAQTAISMRYFARVLEEAGRDLADVVHMRVFYVNAGRVEETRLLEDIAAAMGDIEGPGPAITLVPLEALAFPGMLIEIEGIAMRGENGERLARTAAWSPDCATLPRPFVHALRVGEMIFTSGISALGPDGGIAGKGSLTDQSRVVLARLDGLLNQLGADLQDVVMTRLFNAEPGLMEDWKAPALLRASHYREPGPAATGISVPRLFPDGLMLVNDVIAMRGTDGARLPRQHVWPRDHWDWPVHLPYRHGIRCGDLVFLGGQVPLTPAAAVMHDGDLVRQTGAAMDYIGRVLDGFGLGFEHVVKVNSYYVGAASEATLLQNARARFERFAHPGPTTTGVPVPYLAYRGMLTEIDIVAMA
ncbi:MAG: RidA family protein [Hyphomicrobiaceae bacterium]